jgi:hypothetical protein
LNPTFSGGFVKLGPKLAFLSRLEIGICLRAKNFNVDLLKLATLDEKVFNRHRGRNVLSSTVAYGNMDCTAPQEEHQQNLNSSADRNSQEKWSTGWSKYIGMN